jgi:ubiquinone/menaquinone biosynthesis C-methylase UbiE
LNDERARTTPDVEHWDAFWRARDKAVTQDDAGARDPAPAHFWKDFFQREFTGRPEASLVDVACGHGAVTEIALAAAQSCGTDLQAHCADYSQAAVDELCKRFPGVQGVACDAADMPWPDGRFDYVASQFGIEYASEAAFPEAARLVAEGGTLAALIHLAGGAIQAECADNFAVAEALREAQLMPLARRAFEAGFDLIAGKITDTDFQAADKQLAPAVEAAKNILREKGSEAAGGLLANLYKDIGYMYTRMQNYVPDEVFAWFDGMSAELDSYEGRMASMTRCAIDEAGVTAIADTLAGLGLDVEPPQVLPLEASGKPGAWILVARRGA